MKEKLYAFMQGRYGNDRLNHCLMVLCIIALLLEMIFQSFFLGMIGYLLWFIVIYRMLSRQVYKRNQENEQFMELIHPITRMKSIHQKRKQDPTHHYYTCPKCHQILRIPKGHGTVIVTCPQCQHQFEKRT